MKSQQARKMPKNLTGMQPRKQCHPWAFNLSAALFLCMGGDGGISVGSAMIGK